MTAGRAIYAGLHLLDRQIVDPDGRMAGKVDDLELDEGPDGSGPPVVTAILSGPGALATQLGGHLGRWLASVHSRLHSQEQPGPARVPFGIVKRLDNHVEVTLSREDLASNRFEAWARDTIVRRIPGARHAPQ